MKYSYGLQVPALPGLVWLPSDPDPGLARQHQGVEFVKVGLAAPPDLTGSVVTRAVTHKRLAAGRQYFGEQRVMPRVSVLPATGRTPTYTIQ